MTERKPPEESFPSWIDRQIIEAEKRGVFDNLPGTGKPIPATEQTDYTQAWLGTTCAARACRPRSSCRLRSSCARKANG